MPLDPHARTRAQSVVVRALASKTMTNAELLAAFARSQQGKLAPMTIGRYARYCADAIAYIRAPSGGELHLSLWAKQNVWEYVHHVEANYCKAFRESFNKGAFCRKSVWQKAMPPRDAIEVHCANCDFFESSRDTLEDRLNALNKFFKFLCRAGVVEFNFVRDVSSEFYEDIPKEPRREKRRNPSVEEVVRLVNGTVHPRNRAFYAASAKWWFRPNEMMALDRYASFPGFDEGKDLVVLPEKGVIDKRKGNRVSVIDAELRPILEQYFLWWERVVQRDADGRPKTTKMWLTPRGRALQFRWDFYSALFYPDAIRLGLMRPEDLGDPLKRWSAHCQRHFGEKLLMMNNCPDTWSKHFRGDIVKDARGQYFVPTPEQIREKYLEWVPLLGFTALPQTDAKSFIASPDRQREIHKDILRKGMERAKSWKRPTAPLRCQRIVRILDEGQEEELCKMPHRFVASYLYALRQANPSERYAARPDTDSPKYGRNIHRKVLYKWCTEALRWLGEDVPDLPIPSKFPDRRANNGWWVKGTPGRLQRYSRT